MDIVLVDIYLRKPILFENEENTAPTLALENFGLATHDLNTRFKRAILGIGKQTLSRHC